MSPSLYITSCYCVFDCKQFGVTIFLAKMDKSLIKCRKGSEKMFALVQRHKSTENIPWTSVESLHDKPTENL